MELVDLFHDKQVDFFIALITTVIGVILGAVIDAIRKGSASEKLNGTQITTHVTITQVTNVYENHEKESKTMDDQSAAIAVGFVLSCLGIFYLFYREEILNSVLYSAILALSIWAGGVIHSLLRGYFSGVKWFCYLIYLVVFCFSCTLVVNKAFSPNRAPEYFMYSQTIIGERGVKGLWEYVDLSRDIEWFFFHLSGVIWLFWAKSRVVLSTINFVAVANGIVSNSNRQTGLAKRTEKYAGFWRNFLFVSIAVLASYFLVSGDFFMWYKYSFPEIIDDFIYTVLNGRR